MVLSLRLLESGAAGNIYALAVDERCDVTEFIRGLDVRARKHLFHVFQGLAETGRAGQSSSAWRLTFTKSRSTPPTAGCSASLRAGASSSAPMHVRSQQARPDTGTRLTR